ncbi:hypothetical protein V5O48_013802, partial [Marasmius crinis-equi]
MSSLLVRAQETFSIIASVALSFRGTEGFEKVLKGVSCGLLQTTDSVVHAPPYEASREHNSVQPIHRLPDEILGAIFIELCGFPFFTRSFRSQTVETPLAALLVVTRVCHHWRNVAINCYTLWSRPALYCPKWTRLMLERSRSSPLHITVASNQSSASLELVLGQFSRLKSLSCHLAIGDQPLLSEILRRLGATPTPSLTSVFIRYTAPPPLETIADWSKPSLGWCYNLRRLTLVIHALIDAAHLEALLSSSSSLEYLSLACQVIPPSTGTLSPDILLSRLETFEMNLDPRGGNASIRYVLGRLRIPTSSSVCLLFTEAGPAMARSLASFFARHTITSFFQLSCTMFFPGIVEIVETRINDGHLCVRSGLRWGEVMALI